MVFFLSFCNVRQILKANFIIVVLGDISCGNQKWNREAEPREMICSDEGEAGGNTDDEVDAFTTVVVRPVAALGGARAGFGELCLEP